MKLRDNLPKTLLLLSAFLIGPASLFAADALETQDGLRVRFRGVSGSVIALMQGQEAISLKPPADMGEGTDGPIPAFFVKDIANSERSGPILTRIGKAGGETFSAEGESGQSGITLRLEAKAEYATIRYDIEIVDLLKEDRALSLRYEIPVQAEGWTWWDDAAHGRTIEAGKRYVRYDDESAGVFPLCWYPTGTISSAEAKRSLTFAVPLNPPTLARPGYDGKFFIEFDFGLSPATKKFPSRAHLTFYLYGSDPQWGFRAALRKYYDLFPLDFVKRVNREGLWLARDPTMMIERPDSFGIAFHQVSSVMVNPLEYDNAAGIYTFRYDEPGRLAIAIEDEEKPSHKRVLERLEQALADPKDPQHENAGIVKRAAVRNPAGNYDFQIFSRGWRGHTAYFEANNDPEIAIYEKEGLTRYDKWWAEAEPYVMGAREGRHDGVYIDSAEAFVGSIDANREHFAYADSPLVWHEKTAKPGVASAVSTYKYLRKVGDNLHAAGKLYMANFTPYRHAFFATVFDVLGTEVWLDGADNMRLYRERIAQPGGREKLLQLGVSKEIMEKVDRLAERAATRPAKKPRSEAVARSENERAWNHEDLMYYRRALCWQKPYNLLLKVMDERQMFVFGREGFRDYLDWCLFWGIYGSGHLSAYQKDKEIAALFYRAAPVSRALGMAGWEPVTHARTDNPAVRLERFGYAPQNNLHFTVRNFGDGAANAKLTVDAEALKIPQTFKVFDAFTGEEIPSAREGKNVVLSLEAVPRQTQVLRLGDH